MDARYYTSGTAHGSYEIYHAVELNSIRIYCFNSKGFKMSTKKDNPA